MNLGKKERKVINKKLNLFYSWNNAYFGEKDSEEELILKDWKVY